MKTNVIAFIVLAVAGLVAGPASAGAVPLPTKGKIAREIPAHLPDPFATVYLVMSQELYDKAGLIIPRSGIARRDSIGSKLILVAMKEHEINALAEFVHEKERRCGGFFGGQISGGFFLGHAAGRNREAKD